MLFRLCGWFILTGAGATLSGQSFPWYLSDQYPSTSATGVPTNTSILLREGSAVIGNFYLPPPQYTLKTPSGTAVPLNNARFYNNEVSVTPASPLQPSTHYTFTITPASGVGDPYSFDFTTGPGPDTAPPQLVGFDPAPGTSGVGVQGPFTVRFNKRLLNTAVLSGAAVSLKPTFCYGTSLTMTADGTGIVARPLLNGCGGDPWPQFYQLTVDPSKILDASGNAGPGPPQSAQFTTFTATDPNGPTLKGFFPADGDTGLPLNVSIRLLFSQPMNSLSVAGAIVLDSNGTAVPSRVNIFANGYGIELKPQNMLAANQAYRVRIMSGLTSQTGAAATSASFQFTTGTDPDLTPAQALAVGPDYGSVMPANVLVALRANKRIMPLSAVEYSTLGSPNASGAGIVAGSASISMDGQTFTFAPTTGAAGTDYSVSLLDVVDVTGASFTSGVQSVTPGPAADHDPPALLAVNPPDGAAGVGTGIAVTAYFNENLSAPLSGDFVRLSSGGTRVAAKVAITGPLVTLIPAVPLSPNTAWQLDLIGASDLAGNVMPATSTAFTTGGGLATGSARLASSSPNDGDQNVDVNSSISFTFDAPLSPTAALSGFSVSDSTFSFYPATATVSGSTITIQPLHPLLHDSVIRAGITAFDISGRPASASIQFRTGSNPDNSAFQVTAVSPPDGSLITTASHAIILTFTKAVNPGSLAAGGITLYSGGSAVSAKIERSNGDLSLVITPYSAPNGDATLVLDSRVTDIAGNPLAPFRSAYTFAPWVDPRFGPSVLAMRPPAGSSGVPANTAISWFLSAPVDLTAALASLVVTADGQPVSGAFALSTDGRTLTFRPDAPFPDGALVRLFQRTPLFSSTGSGSGSFTIAPAPTSTLKIVRYTPMNSAPANSVLEVEFSTEVATGQGLVTLNLPGFTGPGPAIPTRESHPRPRVLRLTPLAPLAPGNYVLVLSSKAGGGSANFQATAAITPPPASMLVGPAAGAAGVPTNTLVKVAVSGSLNPLTVNSTSISLQAAGRTIPVLLYISLAGITATPTEALPPNTAISATVTGLEDLYGNAIPPKSWTFTTAPGPDFSKAALVETNVPGISCGFSGCAPLELSAGAPLVYRFDHPLDPQVTTAGSLSFDPPVKFQVGLSDDLYTLTITPVTAFAKGQKYSPWLGNLTDLGGNGVNGVSNNSFYAAFDADRTPPKLLALSPSDGMSAMPLNTAIMAVFDKPVLWNSARNVQLMQGDTPVPLAIFQDDLLHIRLAPKAPLVPHTAYTLLFAGITDLSGNAIADSITRSFTTGDLLDFSQFTAAVYAGAATNTPMRVIFNKPVSAATLDAHTLLFRKASAIASSYFWIDLPAGYQLSDDGKTVTVLPRDPLIPGLSYQLLVGNVRDFAGNAATSFYSPGYSAPVFTEGYGPDTTPPAATVIPSYGTTNAPLNTKLGVFFNEAILPQDPSAIFQLSRDGQPVPGIAGLANNAVTFRSLFPLAAGATYRIDVGSVTDMAGNLSAPVSTTFTTAATPFVSAFQLTSSAPANGDAGVDTGTPLVMNFTNPVDPSSTFALSFLSPFPIWGSFAASGNTVSFAPAEGWPSAATVQVLFNRSNLWLTDLAGNRLPPIYGLFFKTAAISDSTPPVLLSMSPQPGTLLLPPTATFRLTFSKTVSFGGGALVVFSGSQQANPNSVTYDALDPHTLVITVSVPANSQLTLAGNDGIKDHAGNSLAPFSFQYPTGTAGTNDRPAVTSVTPAMGATNVPPQTPIVLRFNKPMDSQTLTGAIRVTQDGESITGRLDLSDGNQSAQFTPDNPYKAGSRIDAFVLETAADPNGLTLYQRYDAFFTVAAAGSQFTTVDQTSFGAEGSPAAWLELAFDRPLDPASVTGDTVWLRTGRRLVAGEAVLREGRVIRFVPASPLQEGPEYVLTAGSGLRAADGAVARGEEFRFHAKAEEAAEDIAVDLAPGLGSAADRPAIRVRSNRPMDPLSMQGLRLLGRDGAEIAVERRISVDYREIQLLPRDRLIDPNSVTVQIDGLRSRGGRTMPSASHRPAMGGR